MGKLMSKISSLSQSMAALFSPEAENRRASAKEGAKSAGAAPSPKLANILNPVGTVASAAAHQDGNPQSPGYEPWGKKKKSPAPMDPAEAGHAQTVETTENSTTIKVPGSGGSHLIRLQFGWDKILLAQKKICEKAKKIFTNLEAPETYQSQRNARAKSGLKSQGCVVDVDIEKLRQQQELLEKAKKAAG